MYSRYFGLNEAPFSIAPNPRYLFMSEQHREALGHLLYGVGIGGGFVLLTGEVGTGKTTVSRCLLEQLPENTDIAIILNPLQSPVEMMASICDELGVEYNKERPRLKNLSLQLYRFLIQNHAKGRNTVLMIDEAQNLEDKMLELIRLLTNLETDSKKLLQIIFIGQPELKARLAEPQLRQLAQRITARSHIEPLTLKETHAYIRHRLQVAGLPAGQELFPTKVIKALHKRSGGIPRLINVLCDRMLLGTYAQNKTSVDMQTFNKACQEVMGDNSYRARQHPWQLPALVASVCLIALAGVLTWFWPLSTPESQATLKLAQLQPDKETTANTETLPSPATKAAPISPQPTSSKPLDPSRYSSGSDLAALNEALWHLGVTATPLLDPCTQALNLGWRCEQESLRNWRELKQINRPGVLILDSPRGSPRYATLVGIDSNQAVLRYQGNQYRLPLILLGEHWNGDFIYWWQAPEHYEKPLARGDKAPLVEWLALKFAHLDGQTRLLAEQVFTPALTERVKLFQQEHNLRSDGIIGVRTLLKLNEALGQAQTLIPGNLTQPAAVTEG